MEKKLTKKNKKVKAPSIDYLLKKAKKSKNAKKCGMFLVHNGVVRIDRKLKVRNGIKNLKNVKKMIFDYDKEKVSLAIEKAYKMKGIYYIDVWLNKGELNILDDIMIVIIGGDIRPNVLKCLKTLVGFIKNKCVIEKEI